MITQNQRYFLLLSSIAILFPGCVMMSTLQDPKVQEPGEFTYGIGGAFLDDPAPASHVAFKVGIIRRIDTEFRYDGQTYSIGARYQVTDTPYTVIAFSRPEIELEPIGGGFRKLAPAWQITFLLGGENWFSGFKTTYPTLGGSIPNIEHTGYLEGKRFTTVALLGGVKFPIVQDVEIMLELSWHVFNRAKPLLIPAFAIMKTL